jgi:hypothetical protein
MPTNRIARGQPDYNLGLETFTCYWGVPILPDDKMQAFNARLAQIKQNAGLRVLE